MVDKTDQKGICIDNRILVILLYNPIKCYNTYYLLRYLQELLFNTIGTNSPEEQKTESTPKGIYIDKRKKNYLNLKMHN